MSVERMRQAAKTSTGECPSQALHHTGYEGMEAFDDVTGQALRPELMIKARRDDRLLPEHGGVRKGGRARVLERHW